MKRFLAAFKQVNLSYLDFVLSLFLVAVAFLLPLFSIPEVGSLVGAATAVYAIVAGFFIADAMGNYLRLQTLIAEENAALISILHMTKAMAPESVDNVRTLVDEYMIAQLDVDQFDHMVVTAKEFSTLIEELNKVVITGLAKQKELISDYEEKKDHLIFLNQEITLAAHSNLTLVHWGILIILAIVVSITVLAIRDESLIMNIIAAGILLGAYGVLVVLRDVDNNRYLQRKLAFRNPQQVFEALGLPPYYPVSASEELRNPDENGTYRTRHTDGSIKAVSTKSNKTLFTG